MSTQPVVARPGVAGRVIGFTGTLLITCLITWSGVFVGSVVVGLVRLCTGYGYPVMWWLWSGPVWALVIAAWTVLLYATRRRWLAPEH